MFSVECKVGRLVEVRLMMPVSMKDIEGIRASLLPLFQQKTGKLVFINDITRATIFTPSRCVKPGVALPRSARGCVLIPGSGPC